MNQLISAITLSPHEIEDVLLYVPFLFGQLIYIMKRAGFSMRAGRAPTRWQYVYRNWDILAFRSVLEFLLIYLPIRHYSPAQFLGLFHVDLGGVSWLTFLQNPVASPWSCLGAGIGADGLFDWLVDWASRSTKVPAPIRTWLTENVPPMSNQ